MGCCKWDEFSGSCNSNNQLTLMPAIVEMCQIDRYFEGQFVSVCM